MTIYELKRIAQIYGVSEDEVREAEHNAAIAPLVHLGKVVGNVMEVLVTKAINHEN